MESNYYMYFLLKKKTYPEWMASCTCFPISTVISPPVVIFSEILLAKFSVLSSLSANSAIIVNSTWNDINWICKNEWYASMWYVIFTHFSGRRKPGMRTYVIRVPEYVYSNFYVVSITQWKLRYSVNRYLVVIHRREEPKIGDEKYVDNCWHKTDLSNLFRKFTECTID